MRIKIKIKPGTRYRRHRRCAQRLRRDPAPGRRATRRTRSPTSRRWPSSTASTSSSSSSRSRRTTSSTTRPSPGASPRRCASMSRSCRSRRRPTRSRWARHRSSTSRPAASAGTSRRSPSMICAGMPASRCGAEACSRPASGARRTRRSRPCRASRCRATCRRPSRFYHRDIVTEPAVLEDGHVRVPTGSRPRRRGRQSGARGFHGRAGGRPGMRAPRRRDRGTRGAVRSRAKGAVLGHGACSRRLALAGARRAPDDGCLVPGVSDRAAGGCDGGAAAAAVGRRGASRPGHRDERHSSDADCGSDRGR